jgi:predicted  nucleic acid-binding Zn-ribbon protein
MESLTSGTTAGAGSFRCRRCGYVLRLAGSDTLSDCPACGGADFVRASLFGTAGVGGRRSAIPAARATPASILAGSAGASSGGSQRTVRSTGAPAGEADTIKTGAVGGPPPQGQASETDAWLRRAREQLQEAGEYLVYEEGGSVKTVALTREWTRIGRSLAADVRFDDPTVSRRHALVVRQADGVRVLDDRSLNGVFVNGARIDRSGVGQQALKDGDEILVGRYRLRFLTIAPRPTQSAVATTLHGAD